MATIPAPAVFAGDLLSPVSVTRVARGPRAYHPYATAVAVCLFVGGLLLAFLPSTVMVDGTRVACGAAFLPTYTDPTLGGYATICAGGLLDVQVLAGTLLVVGVLVGLRAARRPR